MSQTIFITGASSGIGLATAHYFLERGWTVACTMRDLSQPSLLPDSDNLRIYHLDVTDSEEVKVVARKAWNDLGGIEVVVNNAGYGAIGPLEGATEEQLRRQIETNFLGVCSVIRSFAPLFSSAGRGLFINVSSIAGRIGFPLYSLYNASKFAVEGLTESLHYELGIKGIRVKLIEPGPIQTGFNSRSRVDLKTSPEQGYDRFTRRADRFLNYFFNHAPGPEIVAATIYKAATDRNDRLRYPAGKGAKMILFGQKMIPGSWFRALIKRFIGYRPVG